MNEEKIRAIESKKKATRIKIGELNKELEEFDQEEVVEIIKQGPERLHVLMFKNAYGEGLTPDEMTEAQILTDNLPLGKEDCSICLYSGSTEKIIAGLGIGRGCVHYALITRK
jgi:hypothetical protein